MKIAALLASALALCAVVALADEIKKLSPIDLAVQTHKWDGKKIEVKLSCFYADVGDYRCVGPGVRVDFETISNPEGKAFLEDGCDTVEKAASRACNVGVRFVYGSFDSMPVDDGTRITTIQAQDKTAEVVLKKK